MKIIALSFRDAVSFGAKARRIAIYPPYLCDSLFLRLTYKTTRRCIISHIHKDPREAMSLSKADLHYLSVSANAHQYYILASSGATYPLTRFLSDSRGFGAIVVFYYDFVLTMPQEIRHIWSSTFKVVNVLIIAMRYITAFGYIAILVFTFLPVINHSVINGGPGETVSFKQNNNEYTYIFVLLSG